jgi:NAD(P)-dependent dehydrogenase (short-subunit alcohol dehydrogenase family)
MIRLLFVEQTGQHTGRVAVVTGAAAGIGRAYAIALANQGAAVVVADLDLAGAKDTATTIEANGGNALVVHVDVSDRTSTLDLATRVREHYGHAHILINNAAIYHNLRLDPQLTVDIDYWRKVFSVNLDGALLMTQAIAPMLIEAGWGRIVMQTSTAAYTSSGAYGTSKLALLALTRGFAKELGGHGITVNAIAPGAIMTEATIDTIPEARLAGLLAQQYVKRHGQTDDLLGALLFLCGDEAAWLTGQTLIIDGGMTARL